MIPFPLYKALKFQNGRIMMYNGRNEVFISKKLHYNDKHEK